MDKETAKGYARDGLLWLATNEHYLVAFLSASGATIHDLRIRSNDTEFLVSIIEFFMTSDELISNLSSDLHIDPKTIKQAQHVLSDPGISDWM